VAAHRYLSLPRRLAALILLIGLSCLLVSISISLMLAWNGTLTERPAYAIVVPLLILILGTCAVKRVVGNYADIEEQLRGLAYLSATSDLALRPVSGKDPVSSGWNYIIDRFSGRSALSRLEARLAQAAKVPTEAPLLEILDQLPDGYALTDSSGRITQASRAFKMILNVTGEVTGQSVEQLLHAISEDQTASLMQRLKGSGRAVVMEFVIGEGESTTFLRVARHLLADRGYMWILRDISQQKLAEEMRTQFVMTATHELRTPLANIKAYSESLALYEDIDPEEQKHFFNTIHAEATRLARFVDELLNVSQMEAGSLSLATHETDISRLIEEVMLHLQPEIERKKIHFEQRLPAKIPRLCVDKDKMAASLVNLVGNAVKYTPDEGKVRLEVELTTTELLIHVEDTGFGIATEDQAKLFDKFFRSSDERVQSISGSGLGLAFTQEVARLHGGRIAVHSELNKGSRFTMTLPRLRLQAAS
jgi:PAS domain S-box-containing protein